MSNKSQKGFNGTPKARTRRVNVISRLEKQLKAGVKPEEGTNLITLDERDINRIGKELEILKKRI